MNSLVDECFFSLRQLIYTNSKYVASFFTLICIKMAKVEPLRNAAFVGMMTNLYPCNSFRPEHDVCFFFKPACYK